MKTVQCPICHHQVFSETFWPGETLACPHCDQKIEIREEHDQPVAFIPSGYMEHMSWAQGIWKDGRLFLTPQKLSIIGEMVVSAINMDRWSQETPEQLADRRDRMMRAQEILKQQGLNDPLMDLGRTLLDLFVNLKVRTGE